MIPEIVKEKACCFSGHREIPREDYDVITKALCEKIGALIKEGYTDFICGGALGFDTLCAATIINFRRNLPEIRLFLVLPYRGQSERWSFSSRAHYSDILKNADGVICLSENYTEHCMSDRNRYMVDHASVLVAYLRTEKGGTFHTVGYARKHGIPVHNLAEGLWN